jgi:hypothetical protein
LSDPPYNAIYYPSGFRLLGAGASLRGPCFLWI